MTEVRRLFPHNQPVNELGYNFIHSEAFTAIFDEGMNLVEEVASYLDGDGRYEAAKLSPEIAHYYISESLKLTTRLMQIASWLLLQRAWAEGDLSLDQLKNEKTRLNLYTPDTKVPLDYFENLPARLQEFIGLALRLHSRILHLELLLNDYSQPMPILPNPVISQIDMLRQVFAVDKS